MSALTFTVTLISLPRAGIPTRLRQLTAQDFEDERTLLDPSKCLVFQSFFS
jgi:hypothetical protein